jgi:hypothetical protein
VSHGLALGSSPAERAAAPKIETATGLLRLSKRDQVRDLVSNCQSIYCAKTRPVDAAHRQDFPHPNWAITRSGLHEPLLFKPYLVMMNAAAIVSNERACCFQSIYHRD